MIGSRWTVQSFTFPRHVQCQFTELECVENLRVNYSAQARLEKGLVGGSLALHAILGEILQSIRLTLHCGFLLIRCGLLGNPFYPRFDNSSRLATGSPRSRVKRWSEFENFFSLFDCSVFALCFQILRKPYWHWEKKQIPRDLMFTVLFLALKILFVPEKWLCLSTSCH